MTVWSQLVGQEHAIGALRDASTPRDESGHESTSMTHSWLITGPPGSGRSNLAYAFASALLCRRGGCGECPDCAQVAARSHPDLAVLATERVIISIEEVRRLVSSSQYSPSVSRYRVMVIEDAERYGISQLHQLRGRVGRGEHPGLAFFDTSAVVDEVHSRHLRAIAEAVRLGGERRART